MKRFAYIFLALSAMAACSRSSYSGSVEDILADTEPCPVLVSIGTAGKVTAKGSGAVDEENMWLWRDERIHVYAFRKDAASFAERNSGNPETCLLDGTKEGNANGGKLAYVSGGEPYVDWSVGGDMYPEGIQPYHFYAYYLDDYEADDSQIVRTDDSIVVPVEIDGNRDIMSARSHIEDKQLEGRGYTEEEKHILRNHAFCAYTANNNMHPELFFHHHLVRLSFEVYAGRKQGGNMVVDAIYVESPTKGDFTVAHKDTSLIGIDFSKQQEYEFLQLMEEDGKTPLRENYYKAVWKDGFENMELYTREGVRIGGSLMVAPAASYRCRIVMTEYTNGLAYDWDLVIDLTTAYGRFEEGYQYITRLSVYGSMEIEAMATMTPWDYKGEIFIDQDEQMENRFN